MFLLGIGAGLSFPSLMTLATLSSTRTETLLDDGEPLKEALTGGYHLAFIIAASLVALAIVVATTVLQAAPAVEEEEAPAPDSALIEAA